MKIEFYGHILELNDEVVKKHGDFAGYSNARNIDEYNDALSIEIEAVIRRVLHIRKNDYENMLFNRYTDKMIQNIVINEFQNELSEAWFPVQRIG